jgi:hypothetical protein
MTTKFSQHSIERYYERAIDTDIDRKQIINHLDNGGIIYYAKRCSNSKSLAYIPIGTKIIKVILNRKRNVLVSILPWKEDFTYHATFQSEYYNNNIYTVAIYPDCYIETNNRSTLTEIRDISGETSKEIKYNHPFFEGLFNIVWKEYCNIKGIIYAN